MSPKFDPVLTAGRLRQLVTYCPETGHFTWNYSLGSRAAAGQRAGCLCRTSGRRLLRVDGRVYLEHRLAWLYMTGKWPTLEVDHIDMESDNNRWINLREATSSQNKANRKALSTNRSGIKGVSFHKAAGKWSAQINVNGKKRHLGLFSNPQAAHEAYKGAAERTFGEFARAS